VLVSGSSPVVLPLVVESPGPPDVVGAWPLELLAVPDEVVVLVPVSAALVMPAGSRSVHATRQTRGRASVTMRGADGIPVGYRIQVRRTPGTDPGDPDTAIPASELCGLLHRREAIRREGEGFGRGHRTSKRVPEGAPAARWAAST